MSVSAPARYGSIVLPDGREIACPRWAPAPDVMAERDAQQRGRFFLINIAGNNGLGEMWRCKRCHGRHRYLTASCIERPFNGLDQVLYLMWQQAGDLAAVRSLSPNQRARRDAAAVIAREVVRDIPDLAAHHPEMARRQAAASGLARFDLEVGGVLVGQAEMIPKTLAQRYLDKINANRPTAGRLQIEGLVS